MLYSKKRWLIPQLKEIEDRMEAKAQGSLEFQSRKFSAMIPDIMSDIHVIADEMEAGVHSLAGTGNIVVAFHLDPAIRVASPPTA